MEPIPDKAMLRVYNTMDFDSHPLSNSTILDNGAATHLVNSAELLVPGSFRPTDGSETIEAGTQALPISGRGARLFKNVLHGKGGKNTEDLLLKDVVVVEGFYVNIISEARLNEKGLWYLGLDSSLRVGYLEELDKSIVVATLKREFNLTFLEYKPFSVYRPLYVNAVRKRLYVSNPRSSSAELWHARAGHLGPDALESLVKSARGVKITGIPRKACEHCATTHASQVISRRKRERTGRPFWRIGWDLFDMPLGRGSELWMIAIKEYYSGKLFVFNLQAKTVTKTLRAIKNFSSWVRT
jgi:hypothetical protein